jgi:hypothetical protein
MDPSVSVVPRAVIRVVPVMFGGGGNSGIRIAFFVHDHESDTGALLDHRVNFLSGCAQRFNFAAGGLICGHPLPLLLRSLWMRDQRVRLRNRIRVQRSNRALVLRHRNNLRLTLCIGAMSAHLV